MTVCRTYVYNQELLPHRLLFWLRLPSRSQSHSRPSVQRLACAHGHGGPDHGHGHGPELGVLNYSLTALYRLVWLQGCLQLSLPVVDTRADSHLHHTTLVVTASLESHDLYSLILLEQQTIMSGNPLSISSN